MTSIMDTAKEFMMRCAIHTEHRIENYCADHGCVCCYECRRTAHAPCTFLSIEEASERRHGGKNEIDKIAELKHIQNRVFDTVQDIDNIITESRENNVTPSNGKISLSRFLYRDQHDTRLKMKLLCREVEDMINISIQAFRNCIENRHEVTSFVTYMKNKNTLTKLDDKLSALLEESFRDDNQSDDVFNSQRFQASLEQLLDILDEFGLTFKNTSHFQKPASYAEENRVDSGSTTHASTFDTKPYEDNNYIDDKALDIGDVGVNIHTTPEQEFTRSLIETSKGIDTCIATDVAPKVTRNSTKSGHQRHHRIIHHTDIAKHIDDGPVKDGTRETDQKNRHIDDKDDSNAASLIELHRVEDNGNEMPKSARRNGNNKHSHPYTANHSATKQEHDTTNISREQTISCDVTPGGSVVFGGRQSRVSPFYRDILLSTNRIKTKDSNPPGFHSQSIQVQHKLTLDFMNEFCVRLPSDELPCNITDVTCTPDGKVVVCDFNNSCLKLFNSNGRYIEGLHTEHPPRSVVSVSNSLLMFAYGQAKDRLALVRITSGIQILQDFTTDHACVALATNNSFIYVICQEASRTEVHILNTEGVVNMKIDLSAHAPTPQYIAVDPLTEMIYVTDNSSVFGIDRTGSRVISITDPAIYRYSGIATDSSGNVFVCTEFPDGVYAKPRDKNYLKPMLLGREGEQVRAVSFNEMNNSILVSLRESDCIRQYKIKSD